MARVAAAEEEVRVHAAARAEAEAAAAAATATADALKGAVSAGAGEKQEAEDAGAVDGRVEAAEAAAEEAQSELSRLKKAFREERKEHEAMLLESRCVFVCVCCSCIGCGRPSPPVLDCFSAARGRRSVSRTHGNLPASRVAVSETRVDIVSSTIPLFSLYSSSKVDVCICVVDPRPFRAPRVSESRQAANEAVEAALNSADADREEACAELAATMKEEVRKSCCSRHSCLTVATAGGWCLEAAVGRGQKRGHSIVSS